MPAASAFRYLKSEGRMVAIQQADGESELIDRDPAASVVRIGRRNVAQTAAEMNSRRQRGAACLLFITIAKKLIAVLLLKPRDRTHQATSCMPRRVTSRIRFSRNCTLRSDTICSSRLTEDSMKQSRMPLESAPARRTHTTL